MARPFRQPYGGMALVESTVCFAATVPLATWFCYLLGTLPFCTGLIWFWSSLANRADGATLLPLATALLVALYAWMKTWQYWFCQMISAQLVGGTRPAITLGQWLSVCARQTAFHASGWILLPIALLITVPLPWCAAAYQYGSVVPDKPGLSLGQWYRQIMHHARLWPRQNLILLWLLNPLLLLWFAMAILGFTSILEYFLPEFLFALLFLLTILFGLLAFLSSAIAVVVLAILMASFVFAVYLFDRLSGGTFFTLLSTDQLLNPTTAAIALAVLYTLLDALLKIAYAIRFFEGESRVTGADLRLRWAKATRITALLLVTALLAALAAPAARAQEDAAHRVDAESLRQAVDKELEDPAYLWKENRAIAANSDELVVIQLLKSFYDFGKSVVDWGKTTWDAFVEWLFGGDEDPDSSKGGGVSVLLQNTIWFLVVVVSLLFLVIILLSARTLWRERGVVRNDTSAAPPEEPVDVADEATQADALPEDAWLDLAESLLRNGEFRLALRALFLSILAQQAAAGRITIRRSKTNLDYLREFSRKQAETQGFTSAVRLFEASWYGTLEATVDEFTRLRELKNAMQRHAG